MFVLFKVTTVRLPVELLEELDFLAGALGRDRSDVLRDAIRFGVRELRVRLALDLYSRGLISIGRAVEVSGLSYWEFFGELKRRGVVLRYGDERFLEEVGEFLGVGGCL